MDIFFWKICIGLRKEGDWMALGRVRWLFLLNLIGCHVLHDVRPRLHGLYGLYGPRCPLSPERPFNLITHSLAQDIQNFHGVEDIILYQHLNNTTFMHQLFNKLNVLVWIMYQRFNKLTVLVWIWINFVKKINAGYLLLEWVEFVLAVWEKPGN